MILHTSDFPEPMPPVIPIDFMQTKVQKNLGVNEYTKISLLKFNSFTLIVLIYKVLSYLLTLCQEFEFALNFYF